MYWKKLKKTVWKLHEIYIRFKHEFIVNILFYYIEIQRRRGAKFDKMMLKNWNKNHNFILFDFFTVYKSVH
jgi:hypothetical protein